MPNNRKEEKYISLLEAARIYGCTQKHMALMAREKKLRAIKLGRNWFTTLDWLKEYTKPVEDKKIKKPFFNLQFKQAFKKAFAFSLISLLLFSFISTAYVAAKERGLSLDPIKQLVSKIITLDFQSSNLASIRAFSFARPLYKKHLASVFDEIKTLDKKINQKVNQFIWQPLGVVDPIRFLLSNGVDIAKTIAKGFNRVDRISNQFFESIFKDTFSFISKGFAFIDNLFTKTGNFVINSISNTGRVIVKAPSNFGKFIVSVFQDLPQSLKKFFTFKPLFVSFPAPDISNQSFITIKDLYKKLSELRDKLEGEKIVIQETIYKTVKEVIITRPIEIQKEVIKDQIVLADWKADILTEVDTRLSTLETTIYETTTVENIYYYTEAAKTGGFNTVNNEVDFNESVDMNKSLTVVGSLIAGSFSTTGNITGATITGTTITGTSFTDGTLSITGGDITSGSLLSFATLSISGNAEIASGNFDDLRATNFTVTSASVLADLTAEGQITLSRIPTQAHDFSPSWPSGDSNVSDAALYINPSSAESDTNLLGLAVNGTVEFLVDAEGDIFANSLTTYGSVNVGATTISTLTVENNTTLGDASGDTLTVNATINKYLISNTGLAFGGALQIGSTSSVSYSRFGTETTGHNLTNTQDLMISGMLEVASDSWFDSNVSVSGNFEVGGFASVSGNFNLSGIFTANTAASHSFTGDLDIGDDLTVTGDLTVTDIFGYDYTTDHNLWLGYLAGEDLAANGTNNILIGEGAGANITTGDNNVIIGHLAGDLYDVGSFNILIGTEAGTNLPTGSNTGYNVMIGHQAGRDSVQYSEMNVFIGYNAGLLNQSGYDNVFIGMYAGDANLTGYANVAIGNDSGSKALGSYGTYVGGYAGWKATGGDHTIVGGAAGYNMTTANANTYVGRSAGWTDVDGGWNVAVGHQASYFQTGAWYNVAIGYQAAHTNTSGQNNVSVGYLAGYGVAATGNDKNVFVGSEAGELIEGGDNNVVIGFQAAEDLSTGSNNVIIGYMAGEGWLDTESDRLVIDNSDTTIPLIYGDFDKDLVTIYDYLGVRDASPSYAFTVDGTASISDSFFVMNDLLTVSNSFVGINTSDPGAIFAIQDDDSSDYLFAVSSTSTADLFTIASTGYIGIGTTEPVANLEIEPASAITALMIDQDEAANALRIDNAGVKTAVDIRQDAVSDANNHGLHVYSNAAQINAELVMFIMDNAGSDQTALEIQQDGSGVGILVDGAGTGYSAIFNNGNVGIGTTGPNTLLEIVKTTVPEVRIRSSSADVGNNPTLTFYSDYTPGGTERNWGIRTSTTALGDFNLMQSNTLGGDPFAGTSRFYINPSGNVGIGTTGPGARLQVDSVGGTSRVAIFKNPGASWEEESNILLTTGDPAQGQGAIAWKNRDAGATVPSHLSFRTIASDAEPTVKMVIQGSGNVGIGTDSPGAKLEVSGAVTDSQALAKFTTSGTGDWLRGIQIFNSGIATGNEIMLQIGKDDSPKDTGQVYFHYAGDASTDNRLSFGLHQTDDVLNILGTGNVGIGTTNPSSSFHIDDADNDVQIFLADAGTGNSGIRIRGRSIGDVGYMQFGVPTDGSFDWEIEGATKMFLDKDGDLGVGTDQPAEKMEVQGGSADTYIGIDAGATNMTGYRLYAGGVYKWSVYRESNSAGNANNLNYISSGKGNVLELDWDDGYVWMASIPTTDAGNWDLKYDSVYGIVYDTSDARQKTNQQVLEYGLAEILQLQPKIYDYHTGTKDKDGNIIIAEESKPSMGLIAQEVYQIMPEAASKPLDENKNFWGVNYNKITPVLINAIKEQQTQIEEIKNQLSAQGGPASGWGLNLASSSGTVEDNITITNSTNPLDFFTNLVNGLKDLGITIKDGIITAVKLVVDEVKTKILRANTISITIEPDQDNVVGTATFPAQSIEYRVENSLVEENSKIFISFTSDTGGKTWHISEKVPEQGFTIRLSAVTPESLDFDYWIVLVEGNETDIIVPEPEPESLPSEASQEAQGGEPEPILEQPIEEPIIEVPTPEPTTASESEPPLESSSEDLTGQAEPEPEPEPEPVTEETPASSSGETI